MKFTLSYNSLNELGPREKQEDSIYPKVGSAYPEDLFVVCDGIGGHERGEIASGAVCEALCKYVKEYCNPKEPFEDKDFLEALSAAYDALDVRDKGEEKKIGTTMTFLKFHKDGCFAAHIGDSRIYHIRPSETKDEKIRYVTRDHSLVNDLIAVGELMPEQAETFKYKNIITRSMQPNLARRPKAEIRHIKDVKAGDYFFMCTDGMLDNITDADLISVISNSRMSDSEKMARLKFLSKDSHDNHSAHLIHVKKASGHLMAQKWFRRTLVAAAVACVIAVIGYISVKTVVGYQEMNAVHKDLAVYEDIYRRIDSLFGEATVDRPLYMEKWNLYTQAAMIEERYAGTEYSGYFTYGAREGADSTKRKYDERRVEYMKKLESQKSKETIHQSN